MFGGKLQRSVFAIALVLYLALSSVGAMAQTQASTGQIAGMVTDSQGAAIANARVKAINVQTGLESTITTNQDGLYRLVLLPPGIYNVTAEANGFEKLTVEKVEVVVGRTSEVNFTLGVSGVQEVITVTSGSIQVQTTRSEADAVINEFAISNLPINGRRFQDFVTLTPTAQVEPQRGQISLSGQRGINSNINIDGLDYNQPFFGGIRGGERSNTAFTIPQESIREFQVVASGYTAEFGRSTGGIVTAVTKSGTNEFHGSAFYLHRPKELALKNAYFDALEVSIQDSLRRRGRPVESVEVEPAPTQQQWGGSIGGPIKKNRAFFFFAYEQQRFRNPRNVFFDALGGFTPTPATQEAFDFYTSLEQPFTQTNDAIAFLIRLDYEINSRNRFNVRYNRSTNEALNANSVGNQLFPTTVSALSNNGTERDRTNTLVGQFTSFFKPTLVNELRLQYSREDRPREANAQQPTVETFIGRFGTVSFLPTTQFDWRLQIANNLTWNRGNHTAKFGLEFNHVFIDQVFGFNQFGRFTVSGTSTATVLDILSLGGSIPNRFDSTAVNYLRQVGNLKAAYSSDEIALFAQDSWRIRPNFTLNYGLRWEGQFNPSPEANNAALINLVKGFRFPSGHVADPTQIPDDKEQWGPRVGFAWDPLKTSKTVIRGFAGIYNARTPLLLLAAPFNNFRNPPGDLSIRLPIPVPPGNPNNTVYKQLKLIGIDLNAFPLDKLPIISAEDVRRIAEALGFDPLTTGVNPLLMASDFKNPRSYQGGIGFEREITRGLTIGADFSYINTVHLQRNRDLNLPLPRVRPDDPALRPFFGLRSGTQRPIATLGSVQVRESTGRSLYRAVTIRTKLQRRWGQFNAFYTLSKSLSDDDNERDAGGVQFENAFNLKPEYNFARLDRRHQFVANPVFSLPHGIDLSSAIRLRSGRPIDASIGFDANEDLGGPDRPFRAPGVPFKRNAFRNRALYDIDLRAQKRFVLGERRYLVLSAELFNAFNIENIELDGSAVQNYCASPAPRDCGFREPTNPNFLKLRDSDPNSRRFGQMLLNNNPQQTFQMQFGVRFQF
jgi:hypothetical protein